MNKNVTNFWILIILLGFTSIIAGQQSDTLYVDDIDPQYSETGADWISINVGGYGPTSRTVGGANVAFGQTARWTP